jgi:hypothetical protein
VDGRVGKPIGDVAGKATSIEMISTVWAKYPATPLTGRNCNGTPSRLSKAE